jgi:drug/metabolite transporter (DMT)-like permease
MARRPGPVLVTATLALLILIWGTTWAAIRIGLEGIPPLTGVALRFGIAGLFLMGLALARGVPLGRDPLERRLWWINGLLSFCLSYGVVYWAEQWVPTGLSAVLFSTFPLFVALFAHLWLPEERLDAISVVGILLGVTGVTAIFSDDLGALGGREVVVASAVFMLSPIASAVANVAVKKWGEGVPAVSLAAVPMGMTAAIMGGVAMVFEHGRTLRWTGATLGSLVYLALCGSALTFTLYFWLLKHISATRLSLITYGIPVVAVIVGWLFLDEVLTARTLVGAVLILGGVGMVMSPWRSRKRPAAV